MEETLLSNLMFYELTGINTTEVDTIWGEKAGAL